MKSNLQQQRDLFRYFSEGWWWVPDGLYVPGASIRSV